MFTQGRILWSDGLFLRPHHFQQQTRYFDGQMRERRRQDNAHDFGFSRLSIDHEMLEHGRISISSAAGVMPDGTLFKFPEDDLSPPALDVGDDFVANEVIYLCLPNNSEGLQEVASSIGRDDDVVAGYDGNRFKAERVSVRDIATQAGELAEIEITRVQPFLGRESQDLSAFSRLAVLRITERKLHGAVQIDRSFLPTLLSHDASEALRRFLVELASGLKQRARVLAERLGSPERSSVADVADFLMLQAFNRATPMLEHLSSVARCNPEPIYLALSSLLGELSTYLHENRLPPELPTYDHARPDRCWPVLMSQLRQLVSVTLSTSAQPIPIQKKMHGYHLAPLFDRELLSTSSFILAVKADLPQSSFTKNFAAQVKIASIEKVRDLVARQLPGIEISLLPVAPRQLPFHAGYSYFLLNKSATAADAMQVSEGFAFHIPDNFPGLEVQFWSLRESS